MIYLAPCSASSRLFSDGYPHIPEVFSEDAGLYGLSCATAGSPAHAPPSTRVKEPRIPPRVDYGPPDYQGYTDMYHCTATMVSNRLVSEGRYHGNLFSPKSHLDRRIQHGLGCGLQGLTGRRPVVEPGEFPTHKLSGNDRGREHAAVFPPAHTRSPRPDSLRQYGRGVLHQPSGRGQIQESLSSDAPHPIVVPESPALAQSDARTGRTGPSERRSRHAVQEPCLQWRMVPAHSNSSNIVAPIRQREIDLFASEENAHCPIFFSKSEDALAQDWPRRPLYAFPLISLLPQVIQRIRDTRHSVLLIAPRWENQIWFPELTQLSRTAPWPIPIRADLLTQACGSIWHPHPQRWALHAWVTNDYSSICQKEF